MSHHTSSCWSHCKTFTNLYHEDQMLLLAGLHLLHFHVPVITTHLRTGRGGAMLGRAARPLDAALCNALVSPSPLTLPTSSASLTRVPADGAVAGIAVSALILSSRDIMEQQQHHCNNTATAKRTGMIPHIALSICLKINITKPPAQL